MPCYDYDMACTNMLAQTNKQTKEERTNMPEEMTAEGATEDVGAIGGQLCHSSVRYRLNSTFWVN